MPGIFLQFFFIIKKLIEQHVGTYGSEGQLLGFSRGSPSGPHRRGTAARDVRRRRRLSNLTVSLDPDPP
jgi:hypothetical protein